MYKFQRVGILGRLDSENVVNTLIRLTEFLASKDIQYFLESDFEPKMPGSGPFFSRDQIAEKSDLIIVVGGDGTLLGAARDVVAFDIPVIGINRGRLGFLTDIWPNELEVSVEEVLTGNYVSEQRFLLEISVKRQNKVIHSAIAMNDVVLHPGQSIRMIEFELLIDDQFVYSQRSDGLIVSTPTGSTAYALSAGGPIMQPKLNAIVLVPMFPHTLTSRPLVVDGDSSIKIRVGHNNDLSPMVSCDAQFHVNTEEGDVLEILKLPGSLQLLHTSQYNYYETCRTKLGWGSRLGIEVDEEDHD